MTDDEEYRPRLTALELAHEKLESDIRKQLRHSEQIDRAAGQTLQASLAFSGVASAAVYYLLREGDFQEHGALLNPVTFAALTLGFVSLALSVATIYHTELEAEVTPSNVRDGAKYGRKELLITLVETYPEFVRRNGRRLEIDRMLLSGAQFSLVLAVLSTLVTIAMFVTGRSLDPPGVVVATVGGFLAGAICALVVARSLASRNRTGSNSTRTTKSNGEEE